MNYIIVSIISLIVGLSLGAFLYAQYYAAVKHGLEADLESIKQLWEKDRKALAEFKAKI